MTINSLLGNPSALEMHRQENFNTLSTLCNDFYKNDTTWSKETKRKIAENPNIFCQLDITMTPDEMKSVYAQCHVIVLRKLQSPDLLLFCGNRPLYSSAMCQEYSSEGRNLDHLHKGVDTLDVDILMNPSCVSNWPLDSTAAAYLSSNSQFTSVNGENMSIIPDQGVNAINNCFMSLQKLLKNGGLSSDNPYTYNPDTPFYNRLAFQYHMGCYDKSLWNKIFSLDTWKNAVSPSWYLSSFNWLTQIGNETEELGIIQALASSYGLTAKISGPTIRAGVHTSNGFMTFPHPVHDYNITYEKNNS